MNGTATMKIENFNLFTENSSNLKELSKDTSEQDNIKYMTHSKLPAVNFDDVKTAHINSLGMTEELATSVDALVDLPDGHVFIEFKNGKMGNQKRKVKDKIRDSLLIFGEITGKNIDYTRRNMDFILVYNIEKNPLPHQIEKNSVQESVSRNLIGSYLAKKGGKELILFDLARFEKLYFRQVHTYSQSEFEDFLKKYEK